jgi:hypothetical protein
MKRMTLPHLIPSTLLSLAALSSAFAADGEAAERDEIAQWPGIAGHQTGCHVRARTSRAGTLLVAVYTAAAATGKDAARIEASLQMLRAAVDGRKDRE